jgi:ABC-2 type transport system permease protein
MWGLILKDLLCLRRSLKVYAIAFLIYGGLCLTGVWQPDFLAAFLALMVVMLPMSIFSADQMSRWEVYGLTLPVSRAQIVLARYVLLLMMAALALALAFAFGLVLRFLGKTVDWGSYCTAASVAMGLGLVAVSVVTPLMYALGPERGRIALIVVIGGLMLLGWLWMEFLGGAAFLERLPEPGGALLAAVPFLALALGVALQALSYLASLAIYRRMEV